MFLFQTQFFLEGELKKRQQIGDDIIRLGEWIIKVEKELADRVNGAVDTEDNYIEVRLVHTNSLFII